MGNASTLALIIAASSVAVSMVAIVISAWLAHRAWQWSEAGRLQGEVAGLYFDYCANQIGPSKIQAVLFSTNSIYGKEDTTEEKLIGSYVELCQVSDQMSLDLSRIKYLLTMATNRLERIKLLPKKYRSTDEVSSIIESLSFWVSEKEILIKKVSERQNGLSSMLNDRFEYGLELLKLPRSDSEVAQ